jgi:hypothetical protein
MRGRPIPLSGPRRFVGDLMHLARRIPTVPVQRRMRLAGVAAARAAVPERPGWPAVFLKAYARVADEVPDLRRAYLALPWPRLYEYPASVASIAVEREHGGERGVFFGRIRDPGRLPLPEIHARVRRLAGAPLDSVPEFRQLLAFARLPRPVRRFLLWLGLNLPRTRPGRFGTFALSVYSALGAESLHPISPLTTTLTYGVIEPDGTVMVRLTYDHRVFDGATAARALDRLEAVLTGPILVELRDLGSAVRIAA